MKRILLVLSFTLAATMLYAQTPSYVEYDAGEKYHQQKQQYPWNRSYVEYDAVPSFLLSRYKDCHQPLVLKMQSSAHLIIENNNDPAVKKIREIASSAHLVIDDIFTKMDEKTDDATFQIKVDPDSIYDYSYKIYSAQFADFKIQYTTYFWADQLSIVLNKKEYSLSCIDGGMDVHIKYLSHEYFPKREGEKLCIRVTEDFPLEAADKSMILLKKGSIFSFDIVCDPR